MRARAEKAVSAEEGQKLQAAWNGLEQRRRTRRAGTTTEKTHGMMKDEGRE